ncbi:hypothetical protein IG631_17327 [Alternaria alternata]|nr:hypothetical protein IG631_17327 [Alternaria alternata]
MLGIHDVLGDVAVVVLSLFLSLLDLVIYSLYFLLNPENYWFESTIKFIIFGSVIILLACMNDTEETKEINKKLAIHRELNIVRKTIKCVVVRSIHVIGKKFDMIISGMEIAGGHSDGRHRARVRGAEV